MRMKNICIIGPSGHGVHVMHWNFYFISSIDSLCSRHHRNGERKKEENNMWLNSQSGNEWASSSLCMQQINLSWCDEQNRARVEVQKMHNEPCAVRTAHIIDQQRLPLGTGAVITELPPQPANGILDDSLSLVISSFSFGFVQLNFWHGAPPARAAQLIHCDLHRQS